MTIGQKIRKLRKQRGLSQTKLAAILDNVTQTTISKWERNGCEPKLWAVRMLCSSFGITLDEFIEGVDD